MFESCSAYHSAMEILYLSHCTPDHPDKGEKIRAYHELRHLASRHGVHLACFSRTASEARPNQELQSLCRSVYVERLSPAMRLMPAAFGLLAGRSLVSSVFSSGGLRRHVKKLESAGGIEATVAYSAVMGAHAPAGVPLIVDMVDVDSEKWAAYSRSRQPRFLYATEARRLRALEVSLGKRSHAVFLSTGQECEIYRGIASHARALVMENGVEAAYFDPAVATLPAEQFDGLDIVFVGAMDYYPNIEGVRWFAAEVLSRLRRQRPAARFTIVGRSPSPEVRRLGAEQGIVVTGSVPDVRPYLLGASVVVAPLQIARGIQNKVLEALAMGKRVLASPAIAATFGEDVPAGVRVCEKPEDYLAALAGLADGASPPEPSIREAALKRFRWETNLALLTGELDALRRKSA